MLNKIDLSRADLNLLVLFEAVLEEQHVGRAAARLNLSPSAVSHGLSRLRRQLHDPLFLKTPRGVVPTDRALELADPIKDVLGRARSILGRSVAFDPSTSTRRFIVGAPDGVSAVILSPLLARLESTAPHIDISLRQVLPSPPRVWTHALADLEARVVDVAILPTSNLPARFESRLVYEEDFLIGMRKGHPFAQRPTLQAFCELRHVVVAYGGDSAGFVDERLGTAGLRRRVALTVPNFMLALAALSNTDYVSALPRRFLGIYAKQFGLTSVDPPLDLPRFQLNATVPKAALMDAGIAWLHEAILGLDPV